MINKRHGHDIIVVGASAGGVEALIQLVRDLPSDLPAAVLVVLHVPSHGVSALPSILSRNGTLPVEHPKNGEAIEHGHIYVAPPDFHLLVRSGRIELTRGPRENGHRPAVDPLFRSAARVYGSRAIGVILSGALDDGTAGLWAIKARGGLAVVQDPKDALYSSMPSSAIEHVQVDYVIPLSDIAATLSRLAHEPAPEQPEADRIEDRIEYETEIAEIDGEAVEGQQKIGPPSEFGCPDCGGVLYEVREGNILRFRCRIGHAYSSETLIAAQSENVEEAMWVALRALEERAALFRRLAGNSRQYGHDLTARRFQEQSDTTEAQAALIRRVLMSGVSAAEAEPPVEDSDEETVG